MIPDLIYSPEERKFINYIRIYENPGLEMLSKKLKQVEQVLDYIANAIHDNGFTPCIMNNPFLGSHNCSSIRMKYKYNGNVQNANFDITLDQNKVDDIIIKVSFSKDSHSAIDILKTISEKYFVDLVPYTGIGTLEELLKTYNSITDPKIDYHVLPRLTNFQILTKVTDLEYKLLTEWINKGNLIREPVINLYNFRDTADNDNDDVVLKLINTCKNNKDALVSLNCHYQVSTNTQDKLKELNEYTSNRKNSIIELMTTLAKEYISFKESRSSNDKFTQIMHKECTKLLKDDTLEVFWNLKNDPKIHKMISKTLESTTTNTANALTTFSTYILNEYILPNTDGIENCEGLSPALAKFFKKLPLELQEHIVKFTTSKIFSSSFNTEDPQKTNILQSTPNEVKDSVSKPQEQTTKESGAEAVISDNVLAYDIVDSTNTTDQTPEDIPLAGSNNSYAA